MKILIKTSFGVATLAIISCVVFGIPYGVSLILEWEYIKAFIITWMGIGVLGFAYVIGEQILHE